MSAIEIVHDVPLRTALSLMDACKNGYWWCERCERIAILPLDLNEPARCPRCRKSTCKWHAPVFKPAVNP